MTKFQRHIRVTSGKKNQRGKVFVQVTLRDANGRYIKGNVSKSTTVRDSTVLDVYRRIEQALYGEEQ